MGSIPPTDKGFLQWGEEQSKILGTRSRSYGTMDAMMLYVQHLNRESKELYKQQMKKHNAFLLSKKSKEVVGTAEQSAEPEPIEATAPSDTGGTAMNISSPTSLNISNQFPRTIPLPST